MKLKRHEITIAISTFGERIVNAMRVGEVFTKSGFEVLVIHQSASDSFDKLKSRVFDTGNVKYIHLNNIGVTNSRNCAIENCKSKYIWFMDDDIDIDNSQINELLNVELSQCAAYTLRVRDENGKYRKVYPSNHKKLSKRDFLAVGTIEIIAEIDFLIKNKIYFPFDMGAGTSLPVGDEAVFLTQILNKKGGVIHIDSAPIIHPEFSSGQLLTDETIVSKGVMLSRVFGFIGVFPLFYLTFRLNVHSKVNCFRLLLKGFFTK
jgi:glycosyltransferase involved in cell wall biosynthesis